MKSSRVIQNGLGCPSGVMLNERLESLPAGSNTSCRTTRPSTPCASRASTSPWRSMNLSPARRIRYMKPLAGSNVVIGVTGSTTVMRKALASALSTLSISSAEPSPAGPPPTIKMSRTGSWDAVARSDVRGRCEARTDGALASDTARQEMDDRHPVARSARTPPEMCCKAMKAWHGAAMAKTRTTTADQC